MISAGQNFLTTQWQLTTIPGIAVVITGLALSLIGDGLADLLRTDGS
jgi:ABC-type dipeptide/oligopeptide/nickel transport system permease subunit